MTLSSAAQCRNKTMKNLSFLLFIVLSVKSTYSQVSDYKLNCDSLFREFEVIEPKYYSGLSKLTEVVGNIDSIRQSFYKEVKHLLAPKDRFVLIIGAMVDTMGNVICVKKYLGINDQIDSLAIEKVKKFKFTPAILSFTKEKVQVRTMIVFTKPKNK